MAAWIGYALVTGILLAVAAAAVEPITRLARLPTRFVWLIAMGATIVLAAVAPVRRVPIEAETSVTVVTAVVGPGGLGPTAEVMVPASTGTTPAVSERIRGALASVPDPGPEALRLFGALWLCASVALVVLVFFTRRRYRGMLSRSPARSVQGTPVRMTPETGPAVLGIVRPEIAVPVWLLAAPADVQRIVLLHEREHVRSGDPLVLGVGGLMLVLVPWLLPLWWMFRRLRLAVEVDCDTRVLRAGVTLRAYGSALVEAAANSPRFAVGLPIAIGTRSSLERRLLTMNRRPTGRRIALATPLLALGFAAALVACETKLPTAAEIQAMDVNALEVRLEEVGIGGVDEGRVRYFITNLTDQLNGEVAIGSTGTPREVTAEEARAIAPERLASVRVTREADLGTISEVHITLREEGQSPANAGGAGSVEERSIAVREALTNELPVPVEERPNPVLVPGSGPQLRSGEPGQPLFVIDGVPTSASAFNRLNPDDIESISILKDASAAVYGERAVNGVVLISTKAAAARVRSEAPIPARPAPSIQVRAAGNGPVAPSGETRTVYWATPAAPQPNEGSAASVSSHQYSVGQAAVAGVGNAGSDPVAPVGYALPSAAPRPAVPEGAVQPVYEVSYGVRIGPDGTVQAIQRPIVPTMAPQVEPAQ